MRIYGYVSERLGSHQPTRNKWLDPLPYFPPYFHQQKGLLVTFIATTFLVFYVSLVSFAINFKLTRSLFYIYQPRKIVTIQHILWSKKYRNRCRPHLWSIFHHHLTVPVNSLSQWHSPFESTYCTVYHRYTVACTRTSWTGTCTGKCGVVLVHEQEKTELYWYMYWWTWSCSGTCTGEYGVVLVIMELYWWLWSCTGTCTCEYGVVLVHVLVNMEFYWYTYWRICSCTGTCTGEYGAVLVHVLANMELYRNMYWRI